MPHKRALQSTRSACTLRAVFFRATQAQKTQWEVSHDHYRFTAHGGFDRRFVDHVPRATAVHTTAANPANTDPTDAAAKAERLVEIQKDRAGRAAIRNESIAAGTSAATRASAATGTDAAESTTTADAATDAAGHATDATRRATGPAACTGSARPAADDDGTTRHGFMRPELLRSRSFPNERHSDDHEPARRVARHPDEHAVPQCNQPAANHCLSRRLDGDGRQQWQHICSRRWKPE